MSFRASRTGVGSQKPSPRGDLIRNLAPTRRVALRVGLVGGLVFTLAHHAPPATISLGPFKPASLVENVFPGVPIWWSIARVALLLCSSSLLAFALMPKVRRVLASSDSEPAETLGENGRPRTCDAESAESSTTVSLPGQVPRTSSQCEERGCSWTVLLAATIAAFVHVVAARRVGDFSLTGEWVFVLWWFVPAAVLWLAGRPVSRARTTPRWAGLSSASIAVPIMVAAWLVLRIDTTVGSLLPMNLVDTWEAWLQLERSGSGEFRLFQPGYLTGVNNLHQVLQGAGLSALYGEAPSLARLQTIHITWIAITALILAWSTNRLLGKGAGLSATAVFLAAPLTLTGPLFVGPLFLGPLGMAIFVALIACSWSGGGAWTAAALGSLAGFCLCHPSLLPLAGLALGASWVHALRARKSSRAVCVTATLSFVAGGIASLPSADVLARMAQEYANARLNFSATEAALLGSHPATDYPGIFFPVTNMWEIGIGAALSPFAIPRTSLRLWGDLLFDPIATLLGLTGILLCLREAPRSAKARGLLLIFAASVVPLFISSYERPSLTRGLTLPVPMALMAAVTVTAGLDAISVPHLKRGAQALVAAAIISSGIHLFDRVNPTITATSTLSMTLEALSTNTLEGEARYLDYGPHKARDQDIQRINWLNRDLLLRLFAPTGIDVLIFDGDQSLYAAGAERDPAAGLIFWDPGLELHASVLTRVCRNWPSTKIVTMHDRSGLSVVYAADFAGSWTPNIEGGRWKRAECREALAASTLTSPRKPQ